MRYYKYRLEFIKKKQESYQHSIYYIDETYEGSRVRQAGFERRYVSIDTGDIKIINEFFMEEAPISVVREIKLNQIL